MPYIRISSEEHRTMNKAILEALASTVKARHKASQLSRLKKSKKPAMAGMATSLKESRKELENLKQLLPESELSTLRSKAGARGKTRYEQELEAIRERISKLG